MFIEAVLLLEKYVPKVTHHTKKGILAISEVAVCCPLTDKETLVTLKCGRDMVVSEPYECLKKRIEEAIIAGRIGEALRKCQ